MWTVEPRYNTDVGGSTCILMKEPFSVQKWTPSEENQPYNE